MTFLWPTLLWLLAALPLLPLAYWLILRRKRRQALAFGSLTLVRGAGTSRWRRHLPPLLYFVAIALMMTAVARPTAVVYQPFRNQTIMLVMDTSLSMRAGDVEPSRMEAAQGAARRFIEDQPADTRIGVVSFAATASVVQPPTLERADVLAAIDRFKLQKGTAIGSGILVALSVLFPEADYDLRASRPGSRPGDPAAGARRKPESGDAAAAKKPEPVEPGSNTSAVIVVLTDGQSTVGPEPAEAAKLAAERGVRVYTVGVGTAAGQVIEGEGWKVRVKLDEAALKTVASTTHGEYFHADSAKDLKQIYQVLNSRFVLEKKQTEISSLFSAAAAALALLSGFLSLFWFNRVL